MGIPDIVWSLARTKPMTKEWEERTKKVNQQLLKENIPFDETVPVVLCDEGTITLVGMNGMHPFLGAHVATHRVILMNEEQIANEFLKREGIELGLLAHEKLHTVDQESRNAQYRGNPSYHLLMEGPIEGYVNELREQGKIHHYAEAGNRNWENLIYGSQIHTLSKVAEKYQGTQEEFMKQLVSIPTPDRSAWIQKEVLPHKTIREIEEELVEAFYQYDEAMFHDQNDRKHFSESYLKRADGIMAALLA